MRTESWAEELHRLVVDAVPDVTVSGGAAMVTYSAGGGQLAGLARRKDGFRLYLTPIYDDAGLLAEHRPALGPLLVGKSCLRVRRRDEVPDAAIQAVLRRQST
jgi:hypothetical protein